MAQSGKGKLNYRCPSCFMRDLDIDMFYDKDKKESVESCMPFDRIWTLICFMIRRRRNTTVSDASMWERRKMCWRKMSWCVFGIRTQ